MACQANQILIIQVVFSALSIILLYALSVYYGHVTVLLPFIGDIGDKPLESTIFTQCFVIDAALLMLIVQIRFVYSSNHLKKNQASSECFAVNGASLYTGHASAMGLFILSCFQESHAYYIHILGAFLFFMGNITYFTLQTILTRKMVSNSLEGLVVKIRIVLNSFMYFFFIIFVVGYIVAIKQFRKPWEHRNEWKEEDGGWIPRLLSSASEWILLMLFHCYYLTFYREFQDIILTKTRIVVMFMEDQANPSPART